MNWAPKRTNIQIFIFIRAHYFIAYVITNIDIRIILNKSLVNAKSIIKCSFCNSKQFHKAHLVFKWPNSNRINQVQLRASCHSTIHNHDKKHDHLQIIEQITKELEQFRESVSSSIFLTSNLLVSIVRIALTLSKILA